MNREKRNAWFVLFYPVRVILRSLSPLQVHLLNCKSCLQYEQSLRVMRWQDKRLLNAIYMTVVPCVHSRRLSHDCIRGPLLCSPLSTPCLRVIHTLGILHVVDIRIPICWRFTISHRTGWCMKFGPLFLLFLHLSSSFFFSFLVLSPVTLSFSVAIKHHLTASRLAPLGPCRRQQPWQHWAPPQERTPLAVEPRTQPENKPWYFPGRSSNPCDGRRSARTGHTTRDRWWRPPCRCKAKTELDAVNEPDRC